jgi:tRNA A-37 threonylcarbamoyl transferase component Bud32/tetratricopeptide (TPR) repeat protein
MPDLLERLTSALADRYAVDSEIGRGGMATVCLAEDLKHHRKVAIKALHPELAASVGGERFLREIEIVARLNHPHILALHDSGEADGLLYFVMPYVEGESLRERLERERHLIVEEALRIAGQVAAALEHAHAHGFVHRDIKPANIMLSESGALVTDFGVAKAVAAVSKTRLTQAGMTTGTPNYMSPEQASGEAIDARSDIYSLGCVLYEMLGGEPPLTGPTAQAILARRMTETPTPLPVLRDTVPAGVDSVVQRALARLPVDRYGSAAELAAELGDAAEGRIEGPPGRPMRRGFNRAMVAGLAAGLVLAVVWSARVLFPPSAPELDPARVAVLTLENRTGDPGLDFLGQDVAERLGDVIRREEVGKLVPAADVAEARTQSGSSVRNIAESTGAGRIVSGRYSREGDSLRFRITVTSAVDGVEVATASAAGLADEPSEAARDLEEQAAVIFLMLADEEDPATWVSLPNLEAYRMTREAVQLFLDSDPLRTFQAATAAARQDPDFLLPKLYAYVTARDSATADSVWQTVDPRRHQLPDGWLSWLESLEVRQGLGARDTYAEDVYRATGRQSEALPDYGTYVWHASECMNVNRPGEAAAALETAIRLASENPTSVKWGSCENCARQGRMRATHAYHMLGEHEKELESVHALLDLDSEYLYYRYVELLALVGLGRIEEVEQKIEELATLAPTGFTAGAAILRVGMSLRQHGHGEAAARILDRTIRWHEALPGSQTAKIRNRMSNGYSLYYAGRWEEARTVLEPLKEEMGADAGFLGVMGRIAVRTGDQDSLDRYLGTLRSLDASTALNRGKPKLELAQIQALRDDREGALTLLRQAVAEGAGRRVFLHPSMIAYDFAGMADYEPYLEFIRPKGDPYLSHSLHEERPDLVEHYTEFLEAQWAAHQALAQRFTRSGEEAVLTPEQLRTLRSLGYIQ